MSEESIVAAALGRTDPAARAAYLDEACAGDAALRRRVEGRLDTLAGSGSFVEQPRLPGVTIDFASQTALDADLPHRITEGPGTWIGLYKLVEKIGEGGMGVVYRALQEAPVRRTVALKIIKPGMDTAQVVARFEAERQALALMDHPNIARVLDAGTTDSGRPYFVMELVAGVAITGYCDQQRLSPRERLELLVPVCQAVQHAHQKGIIHRDLKPSNVLIAIHDGKPVPKVIDFGVAKAIGPKLTERTLFTEFGSVIGTLEYMSPEQAAFNQLDVDTRSDIYSLGVILYELLTGSTPLQRQRLKTKSILEVLRIIREEEPPRPSSRLETTGELPSIAANRGLEPKRLSLLLHGELDWIVMKALEKDRSRRYETANGLALDLLRYLHDEPVLACPPSAMYRFRKLARRHRTAVTAALIIAATLLAGTAVSTWQAVRAVRAREEADRARQNALQALYFADIQLAQQAQKAGNFAQAAESLTRHLPTSAGPDVRRWEWHYFQGLNQQLLKLRGHRAAVRAVWWRPDGRRIASASSDQTALLWDAYTGEVRHTWKRAPAGIELLAWSPDGRQVAGTDAGGAIQIWEPESGVVRALGLAQRVRVLALAWDPSGRQLAASGNDGTVRLWDVSGNRQIWTSTAHQGTVKALAWSPDGRRLASAGSDAAILVWELAAGTPVLTRLGTSRWDVFALAWSPDSQRLAASSFRVVAIWDVNGRQPVLSFPPVNWTQLSIIIGQVTRVAWSPDGRQIATASAETVTVWDATTAERRFTLHLKEGEVGALAWSPDASRLLAAAHDGTITVLDLPTGQDALALHGHTKAVRGATWSPDGRRIASASYENTARIWDAATGQELFTLRGHADSVQWAAWSPDSRRVATASKDGTIKLWNAADGREIRTVRTPAGPLYRLSWHPDGKRLAVGGGNALVWVCDTTTGEDLFRILGATPGRGLVEWVSWSPDGRWLASASSDGLIKISDAMGREVRSWRPSLDPTYCVAWSPDSTRLASSGRGSGVKVWDARTGTELLNLHGHTDLVYCIEWSPDGHRLASASFDPSIKIWDAGSGHEVLTLHGHTERIWSVAWSPDGRQLASASDDGTIMLWGVPSAASESRAARRDALVRAWHREQALASLDWPAALFHLRRLIAIDPSESSIALQLGTAWEAKGRRGRAIDAYREVVRLLPSSASAYSDLGDALKREGMLDDAISAYRESIRLRRDRAGVHCELGLALSQKRLAREAIAAFEEALRVDPGLLPAQHRLAWLLANCLDSTVRDPARAVALAQSAVKRAPRDGELQNTLGVAHYRAGQWREAVAALEMAMALRQGGDSRAWFFLAMAHWKLSDKQAALAWYKKGVQAIEQNKSADEELNRFRAEAAELLGDPDPAAG